MRRSLLLKLVARRLHLPLDDPREANRRYLEVLENELAASTEVSHAVLLAMDGVYDARGELDEARTDFLISNDAALEASKNSSRLLAGASINPARRDAIEELDRCAEAGAVLVKVLPNAQAFDPSDDRFRPFWRRLAEVKLPLLSHVGYEFSLIGQDQSVGDPARLVPALEEGVTVIAAHGCSFGLFFYEKHFGTMRRLVAQYRNFYVDTSALTLPNRVGALLRLRHHPELFDRLIFGTDYPLPSFAYPSLAASFASWRRTRRQKNPFDRQAKVLEALGIALRPDAIRFGRA